MKKERTTAGPAMSRANSPVTTYRPAPTTVPTPMEVRSRVERHLLRGLSDSQSSVGFLRVNLLHTFEQLFMAGKKRKIEHGHYWPILKKKQIVKCSRIAQ